MKVFETIVEASVPVIALIGPYVLKTHGRVKRILVLLEEVLKAANSPEAK